MAELKRKLSEVKRKRSSLSAASVNTSSSNGSGNTDSVVQLRAKKKQQDTMTDVEARAQAESTSDYSRHVQFSLKADTDAFEGVTAGNTEVSSQSPKTPDTLIKKKKRGKVTKSKTSIVAEQSLCYVLAFFLTYIWSIFNRFFAIAGKDAPYFIIVCSSFFHPMQGLLNCFVYIRPQFLAHRKKKSRAFLYTNALCPSSLIKTIKVLLSQSISLNIEPQRSPESGN
eukprot:918371_1